MVERKKWEEFRDTGLLWFINSILHLFGWAIVYEFKVIGVEDKLIVYPARVKFRGFDGEINSEGYQKVSKWLADNAGELYEESLS